MLRLQNFFFASVRPVKYKRSYVANDKHYVLRIKIVNDQTHFLRL